MFTLRILRFPPCCPAVQNLIRVLTIGAQWSARTGVRSQPQCLQISLMSAFRGSCEANVASSYMSLKKHLHKLCHANNCCIRVPMIIEQHCVVIACATVTCGAWYGTCCWLLHCLWFISWCLFSTWINCIIFHKVIQSCSPLTDQRSRTLNLKCQWVHPRLHSILQKGIHIALSHFTVLN